MALRGASAKTKGKPTKARPPPTDSKQLAVVRTIALRLPETVERSVHGTPGFYVGKKLFVWTLSDRASIAIWMDFPERERRVASQPDVFAVTPHYEKHPMVIVRLQKAKRALLEEVISGSWRARAARRIAERHVLVSEDD